ncbi:DUF881 domain-containing protein [Actinoplanes sp. NPDC089786]|uniref:DUF881 domain-containing protein n=1 Tax=Actinoplanes sp. NPDC089786 TaxID=3155185 RepID=UPI0034346E80
MTATGGGERRTFTPDFLTELFRNPLDPGYADAAERKARGEGPSPNARKTYRTIMAVTLVLLGVLLVMAYRQTMEDEPARTRAHATLVEQVQDRRVSNGELQERAESLRAEVAGLRERELGGAAVQRLRDLEAATGLAPVRGSGVQVTLADGATTINPVTGDRRTEAQVKDTDLQLASNALWAAGAEAIAINGERLTATSTIRQAGEAILVDFRPVTSPYEIVALGPDDLESEFRDGYAGRFFAELVKRYGMSFDAAEVDDVTLDAATELKLRVAKPITPLVPSSSPSEGGR